MRLLCKAQATLQRFTHHIKRDAVGHTADWQNAQMKPGERVPIDSLLLKGLSKNESYKTTLLLEQQGAKLPPTTENSEYELPAL